MYWLTLLLKFAVLCLAAGTTGLAALLAFICTFGRVTASGDQWGYVKWTALAAAALWAVFIVLAFV